MVFWWSRYINQSLCFFFSPLLCSDNNFFRGNIVLIFLLYAIDFAITHRELF